MKKKTNKHINLDFVKGKDLHCYMDAILKQGENNDVQIQSFVYTS